MRYGSGRVPTQIVETTGCPIQGIVDPVVLDTDYDSPCLRGFTVTVAGDVKVTFEDNSVGTLPNRQPGVDYGGFIRKIWSVGTTATGIKGYY